MPHSTILDGTPKKNPDSRFVENDGLENPFQMSFFSLAWEFEKRGVKIFSPDGERIRPVSDTFTPEKDAPQTELKFDTFLRTPDREFVTF